MPKASELKRGMVVEINGAPHIVKNFESKSPSSRGASTLYKVRFTNLQTKQKLDESFKGDDPITIADCTREPVQYSYFDGQFYTFMQMETFEQYTMEAADLEDQLGFLSEGQDNIIALLAEGKILTIELPNSVNLLISDTAPSIKGATASGRTKTAMLSTGLEVQVPEYLESEELIKINTSTGKFISRA